MGRMGGASSLDRSAPSTDRHGLIAPPVMRREAAVLLQLESRGKVDFNDPRMRGSRMMPLDLDGNDPYCGRFNSHCNICRVSGIPCGRPGIQHDPNEPTKPVSDLGLAKPEGRSGPFLRCRCSVCGRSAGGDGTSKPSSCEEGRTRQSASRSVP